MTSPSEACSGTEKYLRLFKLGANAWHGTFNVDLTIRYQLHGDANMAPFATTLAEKHRLRDGVIVKATPRHNRTGSNCCNDTISPCLLCFCLGQKWLITMKTMTTTDAAGGASPRRKTSVCQPYAHSVEGITNEIRLKVVYCIAAHF
jgi:hypothetical protein